MKNPVTQFTTALTSLAIAALIYFIVPGSWNASRRGLAAAFIGVVFWLAIFLLMRYTPRLLDAVSVRVVRLFMRALKLWAEQNRGVSSKDTTWNWLTDQLLVAQGRYAFSVSCIAFEQDADGGLRCLLLNKKFEALGDHQAWVWPGGRFRGSSGSIEKELQQLVLDETGCHVELLTSTATLLENGRFSETIATFNHETGRTDLQNELVGSPLIVMQQNRVQRYEVPGHVDLIYLGRVTSGDTVGDASLRSLSDLDRIDGRYLWNDTRECIKRSAAEFHTIMEARAALQGGNRGLPRQPQSPAS